MQKRTLGKGGLEVSAMGFGCMGTRFGFGQPVSRDEGIAVIRAAGTVILSTSSSWSAGSP